MGDKEDKAAKAAQANAAKAAEEAKEEAQFLKDLTALDPGIAERWTKTTGGKLSKTIDVNEVDKIFLILVKGKGMPITAKQAQALKLFWLHTFGKFTKPAAGLFYAMIGNAYDRELFVSAQLKTDPELKDYYGAIGAHAGKISFVSPGTGLTYSPDAYLAMKQLITDGKITVFEADAAFLSFVGGRYFSNSNRLFLYKTSTPADKPWAIMHELTHAIQDWNDVISKIKFTEADAFIAMTAAALGVNEATYEAMKEFPEQKNAAEIVLAKKAELKNADWIKAYKALVKAIESGVDYGDIANNKFDSKRGEKGTPEKKILAELMQKMKKADVQPAAK
jgi:hypothetical protein